MAAMVGRTMVQILALGVTGGMLVTLPLWSHPTLWVFAVFSLFEILLYLIGTFRRPKAISGNGLAWLASLLITVYPTVVPHLIDYPDHNWIVFLQIGSALQYMAVLFEIVVLLSLRTSFSQLPEANRLTTSGMYRYIRHPLYMAYFLGFGGLALVVNQPLIWLAYLVFIVFEVVRALAEERVLNQAFPDYASYRHQTGMFWPRLGGRQK